MKKIMLRHTIIKLKPVIKINFYQQLEGEKKERERETLESQTKMKMTAGFSTGNTEHHL
jgi:hypothetical protein